MLACRQGHLSMVVLLMLYGADPLVMDGEGKLILNISNVCFSISY